MNLDPLAAVLAKGFLLIVALLGISGMVMELYNGTLPL